MIIEIQTAWYEDDQAGQLNTLRYGEIIIGLWGL